MATSPRRPATSEHAVFVSIQSPTVAAPLMVSPYEGMAVHRVLYTSAYLALFQAAQFGWSLSQLNFSRFHDKRDCDARPVADGTCLMFAGHTKTQWTWVVNAWILGGIVGALACSRLSDRYGRKTTYMGNCVTMALGAVVMASASSLAVFAVGRAVAGLASGVATAMANSYISEIAPPHLRNQLGAGYQATIGIGTLVVCASFFVLDSSRGWRYIAGFPAVMALFFVAMAPRFLVESPTWLLAQGRQRDAKAVLARLFGDLNVALALSWLQPPGQDAPAGCSSTGDSHALDAHADEAAVAKMQATCSSSPLAAQSPWRAMFSPAYRRQAVLAMCMAFALQFSGINTVFLYSSSMFTDAGVSDDRVANLIVNVVNLLPSFGAGRLAARFGNRTMLLVGLFSMLACAVCLTAALLLDVAVLSIVFTSLYVAGFSVSLGPLAFVVATEVFPDELRASGGSLTLVTNWCSTLVIGVGYPYAADALVDCKFVPFVLALAFFSAVLLKYLPETSGKTSDEIQAMYRAKQ